MAGRGIASEALTISFGLFKIMFPVLRLVKGLEMLGATTYLSAVIAPLYGYVGSACCCYALIAVMVY